MRVSLPVGLLVVGLVAVFINYHIDLRVLIDGRRRIAMEGVLIHAERIAALASDAAKVGRPDLVERELGYFSRLPNFAAARILDSEGQVVTSVSSALFSEYPVELPLAGKVPASDEQSAYPKVGAPGEFHVFGSAPIAGTGDKPGMVLLQFDLHGDLSQVKNDLTKQTVWLSVALGALCFLLWLFLHFAFARRIAMLVRATRDFEAENAPVPPAIEGNDEVAEISQAFSETARILHDREERLLTLQHTLEDKNKELESIVYVTSHDLRSPLVNVQGFSYELSLYIQDLRRLASEPASPQREAAIVDLVEKRVPEALKFIDAGVSKMDTLLKGLLRLSRLGRAALNIQPVDMQAQMKAIVNAMEFQLQQAHAVVEIGPLPECMGDSSQLNQVFSNLLDNALKYRDPNRPLKVQVSGEQIDGTAYYHVADNGMGVALEHQKRVFEVFHRLDPKGVAGEGLGLTIAERVLDRHRGNITLKSEPGVGSTFTVELPAEESEKTPTP